MGIGIVTAITFEAALDPDSLHFFAQFRFALDKQLVESLAAVWVLWSSRLETP